MSIEKFRQQGIGQKLPMTGEFPKTQVLKDAGIKHHERYEAIADIPGNDFTLVIQLWGRGGMCLVCPCVIIYTSHTQFDLNKRIFKFVTIRR